MTEFYSIYNFTTGNLLFRGSGPDGTAALQDLPAGHGIVLLPEIEWSKEWSAVSPDLARSALWERVKIRRDAVINGGATTPSGAVDSDELSRSNIAGAVLAAVIAQSASEPFSMDWTMLDNSVVTLDAAAMIAVGLAVMGHVNACHDRARVLRAEIEGAANTAALFQIDYLLGWPS